MTQTMQAPATTDQPNYQINDADKDRIKAIQAAWKAYDGQFAPPLVTTGDFNDNVISNRIEQIVNTGVYFLFGKELEISVGEDGPQEAQDFLDDTWGGKEQRIPLLQDLAMNGAMAGRAFLRIVPDPAQSGTFRLVVVDPSTVYVATAPGDCETVMTYCIQYSVPSKEGNSWKQTYYREEITRIDPDGNASQGLPDDDDTWQIQHWTQVGNLNMEPRDGKWIPAGDSYIWPYNFAPMFSCKNRPRPNDFWGRPDVTHDLVGVNDALNFVQSNIQKVNRLYGHPHIWANDIDDRDIASSPGQVTVLPPEGKMGAIQYTSDMTNALNFAHDLRSDMDEQSNVPAIATGRLDGVPRGNISGIALELMFMPLVKKTDVKKCLYGELILDVSNALLQLNSMSQDITLTLQWQDPLPVDGLQQVQAAVLKKQAGVSTQTTLEELGYDYDEEVSRNQEEDQTQALAFSRGQGFPPTDQPPLVPPPISGDPSQPPVQQPDQQQSQFVSRQRIADRTRRGKPL